LLHVLITGLNVQKQFLNNPNLIETRPSTKFSNKITETQPNFNIKLYYEKAFIYVNIIYNYERNKKRIKSNLRT